MKQEKQIMSNSYMRAAAKKQHKLNMKQGANRDSSYEAQNRLIIDGLRNSPSVHDFNKLDY